ncbi:MAG: type III pantothenate kinase [Calditrichaeota bacterium]|jgi:type III pantothenate kinase|nr:type III pantothenate kinase [Calditrichota bacterium]
MVYLLAIDIGNTTIECGVFEEESLQTSWRLSSEINRTPDECWHTTAFFCREAGIPTDSLSELALSSVVPHHAHNFCRMAKDHFDENPLVISVDTCPFLDIKYSNPRQVGADRLCNAYAGFHFYGGPLIVVDFGTAITLDVISKTGSYLGGTIIPGPMTAAKTLHKRTAQLPQVSLVFPDSVIGQSTDHAIAAGLTWGVTDMIDGMIERINDEVKQTHTVVATGGFAEVYSPRSRNFSKVHDDLVLDGVRLIRKQSRGSI